MSFLTSMQDRYTTKVYDSSQKIDQNQIAELKEILRLSPSSINSQPWKFTFVSNAETKKKLSEVSRSNTQKVLDCDTVIVFSRVDNIAVFEKQIEAELPKGAADYFKGKIKPQPIEKTKAWFDRQVYLAVGVCLSACAAMGIDATPMEGIEPQKYDKVLGQEDYAAIVAVAIGRRDPEDLNQPSKKPKSRIALDKVVEVID